MGTPRTPLARHPPLASLEQSFPSSDQREFNNNRTPRADHAHLPLNTSSRPTAETTICAWYNIASWPKRFGSSENDFGRMCCVWRQRGAALIGGCCGIGSEKIQEMRAALLRELGRKAFFHPIIEGSALLRFPS